MPQRYLSRAFSIILALTGIAWAQQDALNPEQLCLTGHFAEATELINARSGAGDKSAAFLRPAARAAEDMREYRLAAGLWESLAAQIKGDRQGYREARQHAWECALKADGPTGSWAAAAREDVASRLRQYPLAGPERQLSLELEFTLDRILMGRLQPESELRTKYPASELVLESAKRLLDRATSDQNEKRQLASLRQFLADYPDCYWRHAAFRMMLYAEWRLSDFAAMRATAAKYLSEYPDHPDSHGAVSRYFLEADIDRQAGLDHARQSVALYEKLLGTGGSYEGLQKLAGATAGTQAQPEWRPPSKRQQLLDYLGSRFNLGRYLVLTGDKEGALKAVEPVIQLDPFSADEELTLAPFYIVAGQASQAKNELAAAYRHYLGALVSGDSRGRYTLQALSALNAVAPKLTPEKVAAARAHYIPASLKEVPLPFFTDISSQAGLLQYPGRRVAWGDVDNDGDPDLLIDGDTLLRNDWPQGLADATSSWGLASGKVGGVYADFDNDSDLDLYTFAGGERGDRLWRNEGNHFADVTALYGDPTDSEQGEAAAFTDLDADGFVDLYVANIGQLKSGSELGAASPSVYLSSQGRFFTRKDPAELGIVPPFGAETPERGVSCADFDGDGAQDIFCGHYALSENLLWRNSGRGNFENTARRHGVAGASIDGRYGNTLGSDWGDVDNDGDLDLFSCNIVDARFESSSNKSMLLIASPRSDGLWYEDRRADWGVKYAPTAAEPLFFDCNNDGNLDLFITCGSEGRGSYLYLNDGKGNFVDVTYLAGARLTNAWGCAWADVDRDGDLDLAVASPTGTRLLRNDSPAQGWLTVACIGGMPAAGKAGIAPPAGAAPGQWYSNGSAIGARVSVTAASGQMLREIQSGKGMGSGSELLAHFGLGQGEGRISIVVRFPSGRVATRALMEGNQRLVIDEYEIAKPAPDEVESPVPQSQRKETRPAPLERPTDGRGAK